MPTDSCSMPINPEVSACMIFLDSGEKLIVLETYEKCLELWKAGDLFEVRAVFTALSISDPNAQRRCTVNAAHIVAIKDDLELVK